MDNSPNSKTNNEDELKLDLEIQELQQKNNELKIKLKNIDSQFNDYSEEIKLLTKNLNTLDSKNTSEFKKIKEELEAKLHTLIEKHSKLNVNDRGNSSLLGGLNSDSIEDLMENDNLSETEKEIKKKLEKIKGIKFKKNKMIFKLSAQRKILEPLCDEKSELEEVLENINEEIADYKEKVEEKECHLNNLISQQQTLSNLNTNKGNSLFDEVNSKRKTMSDKYYELKEQYDRNKEILKMKTHTIQSLKTTKLELYSKVTQFESESKLLLENAPSRREQDLKTILNNIESKHNESYQRFTLFDDPDLLWCESVFEANDHLKGSINSEIHKKSISIMLGNETLKKIKNETQEINIKYQQNLKNIEELKKELL